MNVPIKLYFDVVTKGKHGQTIDSKKIMYNLENIDREWLELYLEMLNNANKASLIINAGKFLCLVTMTIEEGVQCAMIAMDLMDNEEMAKYYAEKAKEHDQEKELMHTFYKIRKNKKEWNKFILSQEHLPTNANKN